MRARRRVGPALVAGAAIFAGGCATITYDADMIEGFVTMNRIAEAGNYERVGSFEITNKVVFVIADLITIIDADLEDRLATQLARNDGDAVINIQIHEEDDAIDVLIGLIADVVSTRTVTLRGDVVRWTGEDEARSRLLADRCRPIQVPDESGERTGHLCLRPGGGGAGR